MSKIYGDVNTIKQAREAKPGDKTIYINWDAIDELPDEYEIVVTEVGFDPNNLKASFSDVGNGNWMPSPALHYEIAEAKGISGGENSIISPIYEEINISEMNMSEIPSGIKMLVGYQVTKYSTVMEEDGSIRRSSPCTIPWNVWNRCLEAWSEEEKNTKGYTIEIKDGKYQYFDKDIYGLHYFKGKYSYPIKYMTKYDRKKHFYSELKFAQQKAETKAHEKTIRELSALMTGYKTDDLKAGRLIFAKVRRSREVLKMETAARLSALSNGTHPAQSQTLLFGAQEEPPNISDSDEKDVTPGPPTPEGTLLQVFQTYGKIEQLTESERVIIGKCVTWLQGNPDKKKESYQKYWDKAINILKDIEKKIEITQIIDHELY